MTPKQQGRHGCGTRARRTWAHGEWDRWTTTRWKLGTVWQRVLDELQPNQRAWLRASEPVTMHEATAIIAVPNDFTRGQLEGRLRGQLEDALSDAFGREIRMAVTVNPALDDEVPPPSTPTSR